MVQYIQMIKISNLTYSSSVLLRLSNVLPLLIYAVCFTENLTAYGVFFLSSVSESFFSFDSKLTTLSLFSCLLSLGMLLFSLTSGLLSTHRLYLYVVLLCVLRMMVFILMCIGVTQNFTAKLLFMSVYTIDLGYISAFAFYRGLSFIRKQFFVRYIGLSLALATFVTMLTGHLPLSSKNSYLILGILCQLLVILLFRIKTASHPLEITERKTKVSHGMRNYLKNSLILVVVLCMLYGMSDGAGYFIFKTRQDDVVHEYYRLFYVASLIFATFLYERFRYYQMLFAIMASGFLILNFILYSSEYFFVVYYIDGLCAGFILVFVMNIFAEAASACNKPFMWCNFGRIIEFSLGSIGSLVAVSMLISGWFGPLLFMYLCLYSALVFMLYHGSMNYEIEKKYRSLDMRFKREQTKHFLSETSSLDSHFDAKSEPVPSKPVPIRRTKSRRTDVSDNLTNEHKISGFVEEFALTDKEAVILREIIALKSIGQMAVAANITERTVKYRISRIFEKTGTKTQKELLKKFREK